jgi:hypothetical protein
MSVTSSENNTILLIVTELKKLDSIEQKEFLAQLRAKRLFRRKARPLANLSKSVKPLTMAEIDRIKHLSRKTG